MAYNALVKIQMKRASSSDWNRNTDTGSAWSGYLLREAEIGVEVFNDNSVKLKVGNGINVWRDLPYVEANSAKFVTTLPPISKAEPNVFYIYNGVIYYTTDNVNWSKTGGVYKFDDLQDRPKYNGSTITSKTNIPKSATTAADLKYVNTGSGLAATNVQQAIDEINSNIVDSLIESHVSNTVYGVNSTGDQEQIPYSTAKVIDTIAIRTSTGTIKAADPTDNDDVVTKSYFDTEVNSMKTDIGNNTSSINTLRTNISTNTNDIANIKTNISNMKNDISTNQTNINTNKIDISNLKNSVATITSTQTDVKNDLSALKTKVDNNTTNITNLQSDLTTEQTTRYNNDLKSIDMTGSSNNIITLTKNDNSTMSTTIPIASSTTNGLITKESYKQIQTNTQDIEDLKNQGGRYIGRSFATKADLNAFTITDSIKVGDFTFIVDDETHDGATTKYFCVEKNGTKSFEFAYVIEYDPIGIATDTNLGLVLSDNTNGKILVESDGTMSLVGYDSIISKFNNKVDKESGKGLSTNDYTNADKDKVDKIITTGTGTTFLSDNGTYKTIVIPESNGVQDVQYDGVSVVDVLGVANIHRVASTGNYNDLINIPTNLVKDSNYVHTDENFTNTYKLLLNRLVIDGDGTKFLSDDGTYIQLATVAKTGSYNDLTDVPNNIVTDANYVHTDNNFTTALKTKLENMNANGEANKINSISLNNNPLTIDSFKNVNIDLTAYALAANIPTKTSQLTNDSNFVSDANYVHTDNNFTTALKTKLNGIASGAQVNKIEIVKVDGNPLTINSADKSVNIVLSGFADTETVNDLANRVSNNEINIRSLQMSGLWRGLFNTYADLPTNAKTSGPSFIGGTVYVNDYVIIKEDETHLDASGKPCKTRYYATAIADDGAITWTYFDKEEEGSIATATNTSLGLVKGTAYNSTDETTIGKISVATDGTMSVNGIDDLGYLPLTGNSPTTKIMTGPIWFNDNTGGIFGVMGNNDKYRIVGRGTGEDAGYLEIATADNGIEPIYVRQYNGNSGPSTAFDSTNLIRTLTLLDANGDTSIPGNINIKKNLLLNSSDSHITWNQGAIWQRVAITDASTNDENTFIFRKSIDSGSTWSDLATINGSGKITATENLKTNAGAVEFIDKVVQQYNESEQCIEFIFN